MDSSDRSPAALITHDFQLGDFKSFDDVIQFSKGKDIMTIEIENVNVEALKVIEKNGVKVIPSASIIETIKDKGLQKLFYREHDLPTSEFKLYESKQSIVDAIGSGEITIPFVQKSREAGYDGKGVSVIKSDNDLELLMDTPSVIEKLVDIKKEIAIMLARNESGDINYFDPVEMVFDPKANLLDYLLCPAEISKSNIEDIRGIAEKLVKELEYTGLLAIEILY